MDAGVAEYWIVDAGPRTITAVRPTQDDLVVRDQVIWVPAGAEPALVVQLADVFGP